ncbi:MAG: HD domain-containing phosphohydrolase [Kiloniellales bacterium]|nr:HD domain-containing phosphohydrolase [Kiloniellales bacterium]
MAKVSENIKLEEAILGSLPENPPKKRGKLFFFAAATVFIVMAIVALIAWVSVRERQAEIVSSSEQRLSLAAEGKAEVLSTWLDAKISQNARVAESEFFRFFATDLAINEGDLSGAAQSSDVPLQEGEDDFAVSLLDQLPMLERILTDFTISVGFEAAYIVGMDGAPYLATPVSPPLSEAARALALQARDARARAYGMPYLAAPGLMMDVASPIISSQANPESGEVVSVLLVTVPIAAGIVQALEPPRLTRPGERHGLLILGSDGHYLLTSSTAKPAGPVSQNGYSPQAGRKLEFSTRPGLVADGPSFSVAAPVSGPNWWVLREYPLQLALAPLKEFTLVASGFALVLLGLVVGLFAALWWRMTSHHNLQLAEQFHGLATRIDAQRRFLDGITSSVGEWIALKDDKGHYRFVNDAFAKALQRNSEEIEGLDDFALFGAATAERLVHSDRRALLSEGPLSLSEEIRLPQGIRTLQFSKLAYEGLSDRDGADETKGLLIVARDVTEILEAQKRHEIAMHQMAKTLVRAIELRDPYLAGHSRRVAGFAVSVAEQMDLSDRDRTALEIAANLSQIGKLQVPKAILTKPSRLSESEMREMERHVDHACALLKDIDFGYPVMETLEQMHERLDGKGYPKGLAGDEVSLRARILAVCDVFCARIEPRSYRPVISSSAALEILADNGDRYDARVVKALEEVVTTTEGEKLLAGLASTG